MMPQHLSPVACLAFTFAVTACGGSVATQSSEGAKIADAGASVSDASATPPPATGGGALSIDGSAKPATSDCPPTVPPKVKTECDDDALVCDYGECRPQCRCESGQWQCSSDDCLPEAYECPANPVDNGSACPVILAQCIYKTRGDQLGCTCSIDRRWVCTPVN